MTFWAKSEVNQELISVIYRYFPQLFPVNATMVNLCLIAQTNVQKSYSPTLFFFLHTENLIIKYVKNPTGVAAALRVY